ncbi:Transient receptor potential-gamma protein [Eumeta japonica]|uniref:Transient receptor potential-gamma protein n=1 Tax=Eumeta variegata TaxID=151549 RepID=A0A4C1TVT6_EUMVA|nr:Transient receptor potential-gamma protein [Eumeta japonica]
MNRGKAPGGSREELLGSSQEALRNSQHDLRNICERQLTPQEKTYLLHADRGDYVTVKRLIEQFGSKPDVLDINCVDPLNRSALIAAIENENIELIKLLLSSGILVKVSRKIGNSMRAIWSGYQGRRGRGAQCIRIGYANL